jgi:hypothetical protein
MQYFQIFIGERAQIGPEKIPFAFEKNVYGNATV